MGGSGAMNDNYHGYNDNMASEFSSEGADLLLEALAEDIASSALDAEEAAEMCRDIAKAEDLDETQLESLLGTVAAITGWEMPED